MIAPDRTDTRRVAAYLCQASPQHTAAIPHLLDPRCRAIRQAAGRRDLLRNLEAAARTDRGSRRTGPGP